MTHEQKGKQEHFNLHKVLQVFEVESGHTWREGAPVI